ncbi:uncharacterized protein EI90DRAFT_3036236 [Cantharellus anzutake]|uniref:uncharacterized protein n=1 Tax=Cantharellus anzutake TaxID=1750568 RepID=UPI00190408E1|nr:uncharacterized protein EI90DRAFT_3036236 [Cantharellus anzutake]KAF8340629.1 hypothetical protein EI90DRAFT_3036236 [Cantharellus anzutake]
MKPLCARRRLKRLAGQQSRQMPEPLELKATRLIYNREETGEGGGFRKRQGQRAIRKERQKLQRARKQPKKGNLEKPKRRNVFVKKQHTGQKKRLRKNTPSAEERYKRARAL